MRTSLLLSLVCLSGCAGLVQDSAGHLEERAPQATVLPSLTERPTLDGRMDEPSWSEALVFQGAFRVVGDTPLAGEFPFTLWLGSDERALLGGVVVENVPANEAGKDFEPDWLHLYLTPTWDGLVPPADALFAANMRRYGTMWEDGFWTGNGWERQFGMDHAPEGHEGRPEQGRWVEAAYDGDTLRWEFLIPRVSNRPACDGFQVPSRETFGFRIHFVRQTPANSGLEEFAYSDHFPRSDEPPGVVTKMDDWLWLAFPDDLPDGERGREEKPCRGTHDPAPEDPS